MKIIDLKPSYFILHSVKHRGGISYKISDRETETTNREERTNWKTERTISDVDAFNAARALRARIETLMMTETGAAKSDIHGGLFAPATSDTITKINEASAKINEEIDTFYRDFDGGNRIESRVILFKIQTDNRQLLSAITDQIADGLRNLKEAIQAADFKEIRAQLKTMKGLEKILPDDKAAALTGLVENMRRRASELSREINKQGKTLDELTALRDAAPVDIAALAILETDELETGTAAPMFDNQEFYTDTDPEAAPAPAAATPAEQFNVFDLPIGEEAAAAAPTSPAEFQTDTRQEASRADDWKE